MYTLMQELRHSDAQSPVPAVLEAQRSLGHESICDTTHTEAEAYAAQFRSKCSHFSRRC